MKISAVVPVYNGEESIERAIRSIYSQTMRLEEVIVVDDCSSDGTVDVIRKIQSEYSSLKLFVQDRNMGAQAARNIGIKEATGDWIAFLDSDDEWFPDKTKIQMDEIKKHPDCDAVFCDGYIENGTIRRYKRCFHKQKNVLELPDILASSVMFQGLIVKKEALNTIGFLDEKAPSYQETDTSFRLALGHRFLFVRRPLFVWHRGSGKSISDNRDRDSRGWRYLLLKNMELFTADGSPDLIRMYYEGMIKRYTKFWGRLYYGAVLSIYNMWGKNTAIRELISAFMRLEYRVMCI